MPRSKLTTASLFLLPFIAISIPLFNRLSTLGAFRSLKLLKPIHGLEYRLIHNSINCEDLHRDPESGLLFAACQGKDGGRHGWFPPLPRWRNVDDAWNAEGGIYVIDPETFISTRLRIHNFPKIPLTTHGIDIIPDHQHPGSIYIHVINHLPNPSYFAPYRNLNVNETKIPKAVSQIEIFHHILHTQEARYIRSINHPLIITPNDIFSIGPGEMLITNDHYYREGLLRSVEDFGGEWLMGWSTVVHLFTDFDHSTEMSGIDEKGDGDKWKILEDVIENGGRGVEAEISMRGLHNNNGLGHFDHPNRIIINDASGGISHIGIIQRSSPTLPLGLSIKILESIKVYHTIDNPHYFFDQFTRTPGGDDDKSSIILPGLYNGMSAIEDLNNPAAVVVSYLTPRKGGLGGWDQRVLFQDDGSLIKSASGAVVVPIDPGTTGGRREAWLFVTGFLSAAILAVRVEL